ncbi:MAG TPA: hypothetical protein EYG72_02210 [Candidatus Pacebacteria bacterium]|nr:hypothetical protein [Candidatus Paceibacterota bacterium]
MMGRFGNIMMINNDENFVLEVEQYETRRFFVTNVANTRTFDFEIEDQKMKIVGGDIGRIEQEFMTDNFIIAPAERYIFETRFDEVGEFLIKSQDRVLGKIIVVKSDLEKSTISFENNLRKNTDDYKNIRDNVQTFLDKKVDKKLRLTIAMRGMSMGGGAMEMRRGQKHKNGEGMMMGGEMEDIIAAEESMGGNGMMAMESDDDPIEWEDSMAMMNKMTNDRMME